MSIFNVITLFGGLALFLYGMRIMSSALKEGSTGTLKAILGKVTDSFFKAFLLGVLVTAIIQSSTATIVITSGLVAAGLLTLRQSLGIIVGANIGTTVTGQIIRLMDLNATSTSWLQFFKPSTLAPLTLIVGIILIMFISSKKSNNVGMILMGFGILFSGLMNMTNAVSELNNNGVFDQLFVHLSDSPLLGYGIGALVSFILQSSSATVGILQAFSVSGQLFFKSIYSVLLGVYLGDCTTTAIVCSIGAKADAKRVGAVNILYNFTKTIIVLIGVFAFKQLGLLDGVWNMVANSSLIANTNSIFNIVCALIVLPFLNLYEKMACLIIKDDKVPENENDELIAALDNKFFESPSLAFNSAYKVLAKIFDLARKNIGLGFDVLQNYDEQKVNEIDEDENNIDLLTDKVNNYLVALSAYINSDEHVHIMQQYYSVATEFERLGDHATNMADYATELHKKDLSFSNEAKEELKVVREIIESILDYTKQTFDKRDVLAAQSIEPLEEVVDDITAALKEHHVKRLAKGNCNVYTGTIFLNLLNDLERISDVCSNVGVATILRANPNENIESHEYISALHHGDNTTFNLEYNNAHDFYFNKLEDIEEDNN